MKRLLFLVLFLGPILLPETGRADTPGSVERWGVFEAVFKGPDSGDPFVEVNFGASFRLGYRIVDVEGFYDGSGDYRVRFMPDTVGEWAYVTKSNRPELDGKSG